MNSLQFSQFRELVKVTPGGCHADIKDLANFSNVSPLIFF